MATERTQRIAALNDKFRTGLASGRVHMTARAVFAPLSLVSFGGGGSIIAPMQHQVVDARHWLTNEQFVWQPAPDRWWD